MVLLQSKVSPKDFSAPDFNLRAVDGQFYSLASFRDKKVLVIFFICNHCPYVRAIEDRILTLWQEFRSESVQFVALCANDPTDYPDDSPENLKKRWQEKNYGFPYLLDETQAVARAYDAVCTPDIYVFSSTRKLVYRGRFDDNWKEPGKVRRQDLKEAIQTALKGQAPSAEQYPSMGCSIKWKKNS